MNAKHAVRRDPASRERCEFGETTALPSLWGARLSAALFILMGCDDSAVAPSTAPTPGGTFAVPTTAVALTSAPSPVPLSTAGFVDTQCKAEADVSLRSGAVERAVGSVTYVWLSEEQARALADSGLSTHTSTVEFQDRVRLMGTADEADELDAFLSRVAYTLTSWPRFWATRVGNPANKPHLAQLTLRAEALWLAEMANELVLVDASGNVSPFVGSSATALEHVAGVFFASHSTTNDGCQTPWATRALVLTNLEQVESWALGTEAVLSTVEQEMALVSGLATSVRTCTFPLTFEDWAAQVACGQDTDGLLWSGYARNLASVDREYYPSTRNLARLSDMLAADVRRWREAPLVAQSLVDLADAAVTRDAGFGTWDGAAAQGEAGSCRDSAGDSECVAAVTDGGVLAADASPEATSPRPQDATLTDASTAEGGAP